MPRAALALLLALLACTKDSPAETPSPPVRKDAPLEAASPPPAPPPAPQPPVDAPITERAAEHSPPGSGDAGSEEAAWTAGLTERKQPAGEVRTLTSVRAGGHEAYDRVVFEFKEALPGYAVEYVDAPIHHCGSGEPMALEGEGVLEVRFVPAQAHDEAGNVTVGKLRQQPGLPVVKELVSSCDFEAHVTWGLGVSAPNRYRVMELSSPPRLVVDVRR